jgi:hypothetical protein
MRPGLPNPHLYPLRRWGLFIAHQLFMVNNQGDRDTCQGSERTYRSHRESLYFLLYATGAYGLPNFLPAEIPLTEKIEYNDEI